MMTVRPVAGQTYTFGWPVISQADTDIFKAAATIVAGDFQRSINGAAFADMDNLPTVTPAASKRIQIVVSAAETTAAGAGGEILIIASDQAGAEWQDLSIGLRVYAEDEPSVATIQSGLAVQTSVDDLETRLTATRAGYLDNLSAGVVPTAAQVAAAVWAYATRTLTSLSDLLASIWTYVTRTLTQSAASVAAAVSGSNITITRGDTVTIALTGLGNIAARSKLWFTVKTSQGDVDADAIIQIEETDGLLYLNGAAATTATDGALAVTDETTGAVTITLKPALTAVLVPASRLHYDIQMLTAAAAVQTLTTGKAVVVADVTRATS